MIAVDDRSNYPAEAPKTDLSGFKPNVEAIIAHKPDLVVVSDDIDQIITELGKVERARPAGARRHQARRGLRRDRRPGRRHRQPGQGRRGRERHEDRRSEKLAAEAPKAKNLTYYHELDQTPYAATSKTFIGQLYGLFGVTNIADKAPDAAGGYPKLSAEFVAQADPDLIFLADVKCCAQNKAALAKRPGWQDLSAIKNDQVVELDDDIASRWGPRVVDLAQSIGAAVTKAAAR